MRVRFVMPEASDSLSRWLFSLSVPSLRIRVKHRSHRSLVYNGDRKVRSSSALAPLPLPVQDVGLSAHRECRRFSATFKLKILEEATAGLGNPFPLQIVTGVNRPAKGGTLQSDGRTCTFPAMSAPAPVEGQPVFGSIWDVSTSFQTTSKWTPPKSKGPRPMACTERKSFERLRKQPAIEAVPRTTDPASADDPKNFPVPTPAGDPVRCEQNGTFLCRYRVPVLRAGFSGFVERVFRGELSDASKIVLSEKLVLAAILG